MTKKPMDRRHFLKAMGILGLARIIWGCNGIDKNSYKEMIDGAPIALNYNEDGIISWLIYNKDKPIYCISQGKMDLFSNLKKVFSLENKSPIKFYGMGEIGFYGKLGNHEIPVFYVGMIETDNEKIILMNPRDIEENYLEGLNRLGVIK
ncbi:MAG: hypothetical protein QW727_01005 [Candidatus Pacearchaeota archaeon]